MNFNKFRPSITLMVLIVFGVWLGTWLTRHPRPAPATKMSAEKNRQAAIAVETLPAGVEDAADGALDTHLKNRITRQGRTILVKGWDTEKVEYISLSMPYRIICTSGGVSIDFGFGDTMVPTSVLSRADSDWPDTGVDPNSIATGRLMDHLCARAAEYMSVLTTP